MLNSIGEFLAVLIILWQLGTAMSDMIGDVMEIILLAFTSLLLFRVIAWLFAASDDLSRFVKLSL